MPVQVNGWYSRSIATIEWDEEQQEYVMALDLEDEQEQSRINAWMLIFADFIFLASVAKMADIVINCSLSTHTIMFVSFLMTIMFTTRLWFDDYYNRFYENDVFHRLLFFAYVLCSFIMVLNINAVQTNGHPSDLGCRADLYGVAFGGGFLATRLIMVLLFVSVVFSDPKLQALRQFGGHILATALSFLIALSLVLVEYSNPADVKPAQRINTYIACMVVEFAYHTWHHYSLAFASFLRNIKCPCNSYLAGKEVYLLNTSAYQDRIGAFLLIILGEILIRNLIRYYDVSHEEQTYGFSVASVVIAFFYGLLYYDSAKAKGGDHALTHSILSSYLYIWLHLLLAISCFFTNAAIGVLFEMEMPETEEIITLEEEPSDDQALMFKSTHKPIFTASTLLGTSMGVALIFFAFINLLHRGISQLCGWGGRDDNAEVRRDFAFKFGIAVLHFVVPAMKLDGIHEISLHTSLLALVIYFEIRFPKKTVEDKETKGSGTEHGERKDKAEGEDKEEHEEDIIPYSRHRRRVARVRDDYEYEESGVINVDRRGASRQQSLQIQAEAASPKDAHLMAMAAPKSNPLERRGSLLAARYPGSYQDSVDRRKSRISALAVSAEKVHSQSQKSPMH